MSTHLSRFGETTPPWSRTPNPSCSDLHRDDLPRPPASRPVPVPADLGHRDLSLKPLREDVIAVGVLGWPFGEDRAARRDRGVRPSDRPPRFGGAKKGG